MRRGKLTSLHGITKMTGASRRTECAGCATDACVVGVHMGCMDLAVDGKHMYESPMCRGILSGYFSRQQFFWKNHAIT